MPLLPDAPADVRSSAPRERSGAAGLREAPGGAGRRDSAIDLLRSAALLRVVLWHVLAASWVTWALPAVPVLFFATGVLLAQGFGRRPWRQVLPGRLRRLLLPVWVYGLVVAGTAVVAPLAGRGSWSLPTLSQLWPWALPLVAPQGPAWQSGWLSGHLWYVAAHVWFLLLAPVLMVLSRFPLRTLAGGAAGVALLEVAPVLSPAVRLAVGDLLCYGLFLVLGAAWARRPRVPAGAPLGWRPLAAGLVLLAAGGAFAVLSPTAGAVVNDSYALLLVTGLAWLLLLAAVEGPVRALADRPAVATATAAVSARALTLYLWHPAAIVVAVWLLPLPPGASGATGALALLAATAVLTAGAVLALGWVEDVAARRPARLLPWVRRVPPPRGTPSGATPRGAARGAARGAVFPLRLVAPGAAVASAAVALLVVALTAPTSVVTALPPPSDRTALGDAAFAFRQPADLPTRDAPLQALDEAALQAALDRWQQDNPQFGEVTAAVTSGDVVWSGATSGTGAPPADPAQPVPLLSLTKTFTAVLVLRLVSAGELALDEPVPAVAGVVAPEGEPVTVRQLLQHTSGMPQYFDVEGYDPQREYTAAELVSLSAGAQRWAAPGTEVVYTNSGYLWLSLLLEERTGRPFADLVADVVEPLGLGGIRADVEAGPGWVGLGSGGVSATPADAVRWVEALFGSRVVLTPEELATMTDLGLVNSGLAAWPLCPCWTDATGTRRSAGTGHHVSAGGAYAFPQERVALLGWIEPAGDEAQAALPSLFDALRGALPS